MKKPTPTVIVDYTVIDPVYGSWRNRTIRVTSNHAKEVVRKRERVAIDAGREIQFNAIFNIHSIEDITE